jgi:hypothetical protein
LFWTTFGRAKMVSRVPKGEGSPPHGRRPIRGDPGPGAPGRARAGLRLGRGRLDLREMMPLVPNVILDEKPERDGRVVSNRAACLKAICRNARDDGFQDFVFDSPPVEQRFPVRLGVAMRIHPGILRVAGAGILAVD